MKKKDRKQKNTKKSAPPKTQHEIHSNPATATTSRRSATKYVSYVSPYSPASINTGFAEIGLVLLSQSVKTKNVKLALTGTQTDRQTETDVRTGRQIKNSTLYPPRYYSRGN